MNLDIVAGDAWLYVGPGPGNGEVHHVVSAKYPGIVTWGRSGHSFFGPPNLFMMCFRPL